MLPDDVRELIEAPNFAHLAVLTDRGPHVSPVWIDHAGSPLARAIDGLSEQRPDAILVNTAEGRVKSEAMRRDPRVGISLIANDDPYTSVVLRGRVVELRHDGARAHIDALARKYTGSDTYQGSQAQQRVIAVIVPEEVVA